MSAKETLTSEIIRCFNAAGISCARLLVAVSGGADSVVLLRLLHRIAETAPELIACVCVGHVDHRLRDESGEDAVFVRQLAESLRLQCYTAELDARPASQNIEAWAREARYRALEEFRNASGCDWIVTAHHQDDLVETLLFRTLSNRLVTSLRTIETVDVGRKLLRPLLGIRKRELLAFAEVEGYSWVEDRSNGDLRRTRNQIRKEIVPAVEAAEKSNFSLLVEVAAAFNECESSLRKLAAQMAERSRLSAALPTCQNFQVSCERSLLQQLPDLLRLRVLNCLLADLRSAHKSEVLLGCAALRGIQRLLDGLSPRVMIGHGVIAEARAGRINFCCVQAMATDSSKAPVSLIDEPGLRELLERKKSKDIRVVWKNNSLGEVGGGEFIARTLTRREALAHTPTEEVRVLLPLSAVRFPISVRTRRDGDVIRVRNRGRRKVKKLFQERGLMLTVRDAIPIVEDVDRILWIPGVAVSDICISNPIVTAASWMAPEDGADSLSVLELVFRPSRAGTIIGTPARI